MKKVFIYLFIFSYTVIILKPVLPTISDIVAHIFWYSEHMATVHYENGKYHVHNDYIQAAKKDYPEKNNTLKEDDLINIHLPVGQQYNFRVYILLQNKFNIFSTMLASSYASCHYPPPKGA